MNRVSSCSLSRTRAAARRHLLVATCLVAIACGTNVAMATPLSFTLINVNSSNESRLDLAASAELAGGALTSEAQLPPSFFNGDGSLSTLYNDTSSSDSKLLVNATQQSINFTGGSTAVARNGSGLLGDLGIAPGIGGTSGTAPANYGVLFSAPTDIAVPPIDLGILDPNLDGVELNLGTVTSIDVNVALRDLVIDVQSATLPLNPASSYPQTFDASQVDISLNGTTDILLGATVTQSGLVDYFAVGVALAALEPILDGQGIDVTIVNNGIGSLSYTIGLGFSTDLPTTTAENDDASLGTLETIGGNFRLTLPVDFDVVPETLPAPLDMLFEAELGLSGQLIGEAPFQILEVPEPSTISLVAVAVVCGLGAYGRRRRRC